MAPRLILLMSSGSRKIGVKLVDGLAYVCVCVCVRARARACACVFMCGGVHTYIMYVMYVMNVLCVYYMCSYSVKHLFS